MSLLYLCNQVNNITIDGVNLFILAEHQNQLEQINIITEGTHYIFYISTSLYHIAMFQYILEFLDIICLLVYNL